MRCYLLRFNFLAFKGLIHPTRNAFKLFLSALYSLILPTVFYEAIYGAGAWESIRARTRPYTSHPTRPWDKRRSPP